VSELKRIENYAVVRLSVDAERLLGIPKATRFLVIKYLVRDKEILIRNPEGKVIKVRADYVPMKTVINPSSTRYKRVLKEIPGAVTKESDLNPEFKSRYTELMQPKLAPITQYLIPDAPSLIKEEVLPIITVNLLKDILTELREIKELFK
jgi:hypothetical protein